MDGMDTMQNKCLACSLSRPEEVGDLAWVSRIRAIGKRGDIDCLGCRGGNLVTSCRREG